MPVGFRTFSAANTSIVNAGKSTLFSWRKAISAVTPAGAWFDLSGSPGNPVPNYYAAAPLVAQVLAGGEGLFYGADVSPSSRHLHKFTVMASSATPLPATFILCDYLLYYPFIDQGTTDAQAVTNTTTLPRYATGAGVQIMVVLVAPQAGGASFFITYTNSDGVAGRTSGTVTCNTATINGIIVNSGTVGPAGACAGPFMPLQSGDSGVRAVESVTMLTPDVGLMAVVLVKPIATTLLYEQTAPNESDHLREFQPPRIYDGAYLNLLCCPNGSMSGVTLMGTLATIWT